MDKSIVGKYRAKFLELWSRKIKLNEAKDETIFYNGENNLYPNEIELAILNSPTGKQASKMMANYISGKGVVNDMIVNESKNITTFGIVKMAGTNISRQNGVFFHIGQSVNSEGKLTPVLDVLEYTKCRIGKEDDNEYITKYWFKDCSEEKKFLSKSSEKSYWYYPYNNKKEVVLQQIINDYKESTDSKEEADLAVMLPHYRGQVYYLNLTPEFKYALSPFDAVYNDLDTDYRMSMYINGSVRKGFLGKTSVVVKGLEEEEIKQVEKDVVDWLGAENQGVYFFAYDGQEDIDKVLKVDQLKAQFDDKLFTETKVSVKQNILGAANNIPEQLIKSDSSLFGTNSQTYVEMKKFYTENTEIERKSIEETITMLGYPCEIIPIIEINNEDESITPSV